MECKRCGKEVSKRNKATYCSIECKQIFKEDLRESKKRQKLIKNLIYLLGLQQWEIYNRENLKCSQCKIVYPNSLEYFDILGTKKNKKSIKCKECKLKNKTKCITNGFKKCRKCENEFPETKEFFYEENGKFRASCKKCINKIKKLYIKKTNYKSPSRGITKRRAKHRRKARLRNLPFSYTKIQWENCKKYFNERCCYCGDEPESLAQEHFIALSKGGGYVRNNIFPACNTCNSYKSDKDFFIWYPKQSFYSKERENMILGYLGFLEKVQNYA